MFLPASEVALAPDLSISDSCSNTSLRKHKTTCRPTRSRNVLWREHTNTAKRNPVCCVWCGDSLKLQNIFALHKYSPLSFYRNHNLSNTKANAASAKTIKIKIPATLGQGGWSGSSSFIVAINVATLTCACRRRCIHCGHGPAGPPLPVCVTRPGHCRSATTASSCRTRR